MKKNNALKIIDAVTNCMIIALGIFGGAYALYGIKTGDFIISKLSFNTLTYYIIIATITTILCCFTCKDKL